MKSNQILSIIKEAKWVKKAIEFDTQEELNEYKKNHDIRPNTILEVKNKDKNVDKTDSIIEDVKDKLKTKQDEIKTDKNTDKKLLNELNSKRENNLSKYDNKDIKLNTEKSTEKLTNKNISQFKKSISNNAELVLKKYSKTVSPESSKRVSEEINRLSSFIEKGVNDGSLNVNADKIDDLVQNQIKNLIHQEVETKRRALGDHGIRHILANSKNTHRVLDELENSGHKFTGAERLAASLTQINHDIGYTLSEAATSIKGTSRHKEFSEQVFGDESEKYEEILGKELTSNVKNWIGTHDDIKYDWKNDPIASSIRLADNTSLFAEDKVPELFFKHEDTTKTLGKIRLAMSLGQDTGEYKKQLKTQISSMDISDIEKDELNEAVDELNDFGVNDVLARMSGKLDNYKFNKEKGVMEVNLSKSPEFDIIQKTFDNLGQKKFISFIEDHDKNKLREDIGNKTILKDETGKPIIEVNIDDSNDTKTDNKQLNDYLSKTVRYELGNIKSGFNPKNIDELSKHPIREKLKGVELKLYDKIVITAKSRLKHLGLDKKDINDYTDQDKSEINKIKSLFGKFPPTETEVELLNE